MRAYLTASLIVLSTLAAATRADARDAPRTAVPMDHTIDGFTPVTPAVAPAAPSLPAFPGRVAAPTPTCGGLGGASSSVRTFGWVDDENGLALPDAVWTFDHTPADPWEGWTAHDLTTNEFTAFRHVDNTAWGGHNNLVAPPIIEGTGSVWLGFYQDEADSACWESGIGYGNSWHQRLTSPPFENSVGSNVGITFDYWYDCESIYDQVTVIVDDGVTETTIATFSGQGGTYQSPLSFSQSVAVTGQFNVIFQFYSDDQNSDEDDGWPTSVGAFGLDEFNITGLEDWAGPGPPYEFESGLGGWVASAVVGVGSFAGINNWNNYGIGSCGQSGNVVTFHDGSIQHPGGQHERIVSPPVDVSSYGTTPMNVWAEYDIYSNLPFGDNVVWKWGFQYYPAICAVTGDSIWSEPDGPGPFANNFPVCTRIRSYANDLSAPSVYSSGTTLVPAGADSIRLVFEVEALGLTAGNESPIFDNIEIGVSDAASILHVPSPQYPTIASATGVVSAGDTIVVRAGTYTGALNKDVTLDGTAAALVSEDGSGATIIDCQQAGRGFLFNNAETPATVVDGFTVVHGQVDLVGNGIYVFNNSSPTIRDVVIRDTRVIGSAYGTVRIDSGDPIFECFVAEHDTATASGGLVIVNGGVPEFDTCIIQENVSQFSCVSLVGGSPKLTNVAVFQNVTTNAVIVDTDAGFENCSIVGNSDVGMYFFPASPSTVDSCTVAYNGTGGLVIEDNSSTFTACDILVNEGAGAEITNVNFAGAAPERATPARSNTTMTFIDCVIAGNVNTSASGGGVRFDCGNTPTSVFAPYFEDCVITGNASLFSGGGIAVCGTALFTDIAPTFSNCTVSSNSAGDDGGGIHVDVNNSGSEIYQGWVTMERTIMWGNCASGQGNDAYTTPDNILQFECADLDSTGIAGSGSVVYQDEQVFQDPEFCTPAECSPSGTLAGEFTISMSSPANPLNSPCGQLIGAGDPQCSPPTGVGDDSGVPAATALVANVPNPFNPTTTIRFNVARKGQVSLVIFDVRGHRVRTLVDGPLDAAVHQRRWDGTDDSGRRVATGVYFARLAAGTTVDVHKLVLLK